MKDKKGLVGFTYAWNGLKEVVMNERNFRIHLVVAIIVAIIGSYTRLTNVEWGIILLVFGLVLVTEMINSAIEKMLDYLDPKIDPRAKVIKDIAAGAVLVTAFVAVIIGLLIFLPKWIIF